MLILEQWFQINETVTGGVNTTPETVTLTKHISEAVKQECESMTFEVSSHGLVIGRLRGVEFDIAIFSNLTQDRFRFSWNNGSIWSCQIIII